MSLITITDINAMALDPVEKAAWIASLSAKDLVTATAGGGQATAYQINDMTTRVSVCATGGDSSKLPKATAGLFLIVINAGVASMNLFPAVGEQINALGANAAFAVGIAKVAIVIASGPGQWHTVLTA